MQPDEIYFVTTYISLGTEWQLSVDRRRSFEGPAKSARSISRLSRSRASQLPLLRVLASLSLKQFWPDF